LRQRYAEAELAKPTETRTATTSPGKGESAARSLNVVTPATAGAALFGVQPRRNGGGERGGNEQSNRRTRCRSEAVTRSLRQSMSRPPAGAQGAVDHVPSRPKSCPTCPSEPSKAPEAASRGGCRKSAEDVGPGTDESSSRTDPSPATCHAHRLGWRSSREIVSARSRLIKYFGRLRACPARENCGRAGPHHPLTTMLLRQHGLAVTAPESGGYAGGVRRAKAQGRHRRACGPRSVPTQSGGVRALARPTDKGLPSAHKPARFTGATRTGFGDNNHHLICRKLRPDGRLDCAIGIKPCLTAADDSGYEMDERRGVI